MTVFYDHVEDVILFFDNTYMKERERRGAPSREIRDEHILISIFNDFIFFYHFFDLFS
jgi:hypothetical protein